MNRKTDSCDLFQLSTKSGLVIDNLKIECNSNVWASIENILSAADKQYYDSSTIV